MDLNFRAEVRTTALSMTAIVKLKAKADKKREAYSFRIMQMQVDLQEGRTAQAKEAKAFKECLDIVEEHALEVAKGGPERHTDLPLSLEALFGRGGNGSLN